MVEMVNKILVRSVENMEWKNITEKC